MLVDKFHSFAISLASHGKILVAHSQVTLGELVAIFDKGLGYITMLVVVFDLVDLFVLPRANEFNIGDRDY